MLALGLLIAVAPIVAFGTLALIAAVALLRTERG
jgi:hypothetical protein